MARDTGGMLQGTLSLLILRALAARELHGYGVARWIRQASGDALEIEEGSLYPALRRLEDRGLVTARWDLTEQGRRARFYALTPAGRSHLQADASTWLHFAGAIMRVLATEPAASH